MDKRHPPWSRREEQHESIVKIKNKTMNGRLKRKE